MPLLVNLLFLLLLCTSRLNAVLARSALKVFLLYAVSLFNSLAGFNLVNGFGCLEKYIIAIANARCSAVSSLVGFCVLLVSSCVILNSIDYLSVVDSHSFLAYLLSFQFAMVTFVFAHDLLLSFLCWDVLGIVSYLLINFWSSRVNSGVKAIIYNKVGDCCFVLIIAASYSFLQFLHYYTFISFLIVFTLFFGFALSYATPHLPIWICVLTVVFSKSAQLPFSSWLLNAMAAPTPVSALLHSSTMVLAGVVVGLMVEEGLATVLDSSSLFYLVLILLLLCTLCWSGIKAIVCCDVKAVVAFSTISQISYMFIALLINPGLTLYHIIIHALFKSFLFLLSGSAIHVQHNHQSTFKLKIKHTLIKTLFLASGCAMVLAISKLNGLRATYN